MPHYIEQFIDTDSCREKAPTELPVPNGSMQHREPKSEIDDTRMILQGASCTIAAAGIGARWPLPARAHHYRRSPPA